MSNVKWGNNSVINFAFEKSPYKVFFGYRPRDINKTFFTSEVTYNKRQNLKMLRDERSNETRETIMFVGKVLR